MSFSDELRAKVEELKSAAKQRYLEELEGRGLVVEDDGRFTPTVAYGPGGTEDEQQLIEQEQIDYGSFLREVGDLAERFEPYYELSYSPFTTMVNTLGAALDLSGQDAASQLGHPERQDAGSTAYGQVRDADESWVRPVLELINEGLWYGGAAQTFHDDFLEPLHDAAQVQMSCIRELTIAAQSYREATIKAQQDITNVADLTIAELRGAGRGDINDVFNLVGVVASAIGFGMSTGGFGLAVSTVSLALSGYSAFAGIAQKDHGDPPPLVVEGAIARQIVPSAWDAIRVFEQLMVDADTEIQQGLLAGLDDHRLFASSDLKPPRPEIADGEPFGTLTIPPGTLAPGVPIEASPVVVQIVSLYQAGYEHLPNAAALYRQAAETVRGLSLPTHPYYLTAVSRHSFEEARDRIGDVLSHMSSALADCGTALVRTAETYDGTDAENAEILRQEGLIFPPLPGGPPPVGFPT